ncbi:hypothetical protein H2136_21930 [Aeromonas hydrophila]|uniref:Uncharacterized protein n=1 Tax=Aeromonas hydrophila TaxID=644 RepID=A0A926ITY6_AERHY|nr:hypothetical protein [Aeromonas hydrophila]
MMPATVAARSTAPTAISSRHSGMQEGVGHEPDKQDKRDGRGRCGQGSSGGRQPAGGALDRYFMISERGSNVRQEVLAGSPPSSPWSIR